MRIRLLAGLGIYFVVVTAGVVHAQEVPDMVLVNGRVFTGAESSPYVEAVAIKGARILAVGTSQEISSSAGAKTQRIDLAGRLVIPGINDAHVHFNPDSIGTNVDFGGLAPTCAHVLDLLEKVAGKVPAGTLLTGTIGPEAFFDPACTPAALDRIAPGDAVVLWTWSPHAGMLNQAAAQRSPCAPEKPNRSLYCRSPRLFYYDTAKHDWNATPGEFGILVGSSSVDIKLQGKYALVSGDEHR